MYSEKIEKFIHDGWVILDIPNPDIIYDYAGQLQKKAQEITGIACSLADLHHHVDEEQFKKLHQGLAEYFWESEFSLRSSNMFLTLVKEFIGLDVMVQYMPYLRLARPYKAQDNIGYHKDTQYGQTPYELAVHVPFVDLDEDAALRVISGSHQQPESAYMGMAAETNDQVIKGSIEHRLGRPYAPKRLAVPEGAKTEPLTMRLGQAAFFSPALFHGQEMNRGAVTRVSTDLRYVNPNVNVELKIGKVHAGYVPIAHSPIHQTALDYYQAQRVDA